MTPVQAVFAVLLLLRPRSRRCPNSNALPRKLNCLRPQAAHRCRWTPTSRALQWSRSSDGDTRGWRLVIRKTQFPLGSRPTVVLTRGDEKNAGRESSHGALAKLSSNSRHSIVVGSGHEIHLFEPAAVITAIADVVRAVREKSTLRP